MRLTEADVLMDLYANRLELLAERYGLDSSECGVLAGAMKLLEAQPTIEERKTGKWIYKEDLRQFFCSQCGEPSLTDDDRYIYGMDFSNFCPNCGAEMRGEQE